MSDTTMDPSAVPDTAEVGNENAILTDALEAVFGPGTQLDVILSYPNGTEIVDAVSAAATKSDAERDAAAAEVRHLLLQGKAAQLFQTASAQSKYNRGGKILWAMVENDVKKLLKTAVSSGLSPTSENALKSVVGAARTQVENAHNEAAIAAVVAAATAAASAPAAAPAATPAAEPDAAAAPEAEPASAAAAATAGSFGIDLSDLDDATAAPEAAPDEVPAAPDFGGISGSFSAPAAAPAATPAAAPATPAAAPASTPAVTPAATAGIDELDALLAGTAGTSGAASVDLSGLTGLAPAADPAIPAVDPAAAVTGVDVPLDPDNLKVPTKSFWPWKNKKTDTVEEPSVVVAPELTETPGSKAAPAKPRGPQAGIATAVVRLPGQPAATPAATPSANPAVPSAPKKPLSRTSKIIGGLALAGVVGGGALAYKMNSGSDTGHVSTPTAPSAPSAAPSESGEKPVVSVTLAPGDFEFDTYYGVKILKKLALPAGTAPESVKTRITRDNHVTLSYLVNHAGHGTLVRLVSKEPIRMRADAEQTLNFVEPLPGKAPSVPIATVSLNVMYGNKDGKFQLLDVKSTDKDLDLTKCAPAQTAGPSEMFALSCAIPGEEKPEIISVRNVNVDRSPAMDGKFQPVTGFMYDKE